MRQQGDGARIGAVALPALGTDPAHEPLGQDALERRRDEVRLDLEVHEPGDGARGVVGMQGGEREMSRERCLHGDRRGLPVPHLADHQDIGILAQDAAQRARERHPRLDVDRHLRDAIEVVLDRVLDGDDLLSRALPEAERRIERGGLATARGPRGEEDPVGALG